MPSSYAETTVDPVFVVAALSLGADSVADRCTARPVDCAAATPAQALAPLPVAAFRAAPEVGRAIEFILSLQPEGTYILSRVGVNGVVPMDLAHAALALCQAGHLREAEAALDWLLALQTRSGEAGSVVVREVDEETITIDYAGAWYDHYQVDGSPKVRMTRGRGEAVGLTLIALATVVHADPAYAAQVVAGEPVVAYVARAAGYLRQPVLQKADGRFHHRPDYQVSFGEEASRMGLGLRLAGELLAAAGPGYAQAAREAREAGDRGVAQLATGELAVGMSYDYYAQAIWGLTNVEGARAEQERAEAAGVVTPYGVRRYDWQRLNAHDWRQELSWWARERVVGASESFDWGLACLAAGDLAGAIRVEQAWLALQDADGGFPDGYLPTVGATVGAPTSYAAARFVLLERTLTAATTGAMVAAVP
ncbi:MAG: hypothetical protein U0841_31485 [Chloroflexia bacterium]